MSHYCYLDHVIQNDNRDFYSSRYIFNLVSHYFYSANDTNKVVSQPIIQNTSSNWNARVLLSTIWLFCFTWRFTADSFKSSVYSL